MAIFRTQSEVALRAEAFGGLHQWFKSMGGGEMSRDTFSDKFLAFRWQEHIFICYDSAIVLRGDPEWHFYETDLEELKAMVSMILFESVQ